MKFFKGYAYIILGVACVLALGGLYLAGRDRPTGVVDTGQPIVAAPVSPGEAAAQTPEEISEPDAPEAETSIMVHIVGAVRSPGVYEVPQGSRVNDVLLLAGGHTEDADLSLINLAAFVQDAMQIRIPVIGEEPQTQAADGQNQSATTADGRVNINLANLTELQTLPGIGPVIAQNIIDFREANGGFNSIDELLNVSRIGDATLERLRDMVTIN